MKRLTIGALLAGQLLSVAQPAFAADLVAWEAPQMGAFAGARLRVPLGGARDERRLRAGLTLAPTLRTSAADGESQLRFGEGLELGVTGRQPVRLLLAGQDVRRLGAAEDNDDRGGGPSTLGWIAIGVGTFLIVAVGAAALAADHILDNERRGPDGS
jgi:hypothetical protein